jgi:hypothetical protein
LDKIDAFGNMGNLQSGKKGYGTGLFLRGGAGAIA